MAALTKNQNKWGFACGRVSALEGQLIPQETFYLLAGLDRVQDVFNRLQETSLREHMTHGALTWEDWSTVIDNYVHSQILSLRQCTPNPAICDLYSLSEDYLNLKRAVQNRGSFPFGKSQFSESRLLEVASGNGSLLPEIIRPALSPVLGGGSQEENSQFVLDVTLDGAFLRHYLFLAHQSGAPFIEEWATLRVLGRALVAMWRAFRAGQQLKVFPAHLLPLNSLDGLITEISTIPDPKAWGASIPGRAGDLWQAAFEVEEDEQVSTFETLLANHLTELAQRVKLQTAGPERVAGYLWGLWIAAYNLKLVISGKLNNLDENLLKKRIRNTYV